MTAAAPATVDRPAFLAGVRASGVVADGRLDRALASASIAPSARELAEHLVADGALTRYQAERLLVGRSDGFLIGPYIIVDHLGKSGTGRVFKARHRTMNRWVAIKLLAAHLTATTDIRDAVRVEARAAARLVHPNLVTLLDVNQAGDRMYFVKEYLDGPSLAVVLRESGKLSVALAGEVVRQAALGLQHAHEKGIAHGRVSPTAILLGPPSRNGTADRPLVKVSGFELGRFATETDGGATDFEYRAPELFADPERNTPAADVYALGCVLFHSLAGHPPYPATTPAEVAHACRVHPVPSVAHLRPDVPPSVAALVAAMLNTNPTARPAAEEVAMRLSALDATTADDAVSLNLTPPSYSAATSILQPHSAVHVLLPVASPFTEMTLGSDPHEPTPIATAKGKKPKRKAGRHDNPGLSPTVAIAVLLLIAGAVGFILLTMVKRATAAL